MHRNKKKNMGVRHSIRPEKEELVTLKKKKGKGGFSGGPQ
jgi:hypothetical protein